ncbi:hypothetical protein EBR43_12505 [bacterium]|nr:hypothetical protein [bacterium]
MKSCTGQSLIKKDFEIANQGSITDVLINLDFHDNTVISLEQMNIADENIKNFKILEYLTIKSSNSGTSGKYSFFLESFLRQCKKLRSLTVDGNIDQEFLDALTRILLNQPHQLHELRVIHVRLPFTFLHNLKKIVHQESSIKRLDLTQTGLSSDEMKIIASLLNDNQQLASLILDDNNIQRKGAQSLANSLRKHQGLVELSLQKTHIGNQGFDVLTDAIEHNRLLMFFKFSSDCELNNADSNSKLLSFLKRNNMSITPSVNHNRLTPLGVLALNQRAWVFSLEAQKIYSNPALKQDKLLPIIQTKKKNIELFSDATTEVLSYLSFQEQQKLLLLSCTAQQSHHASYLTAALMTPHLIARAVYSCFKKSR